MSTKANVPDPLLRTPDDQLSKEERNKLASDYAQGQLHDHFRDFAEDKVAWETEQLAKSHGIYLEYNRAKTGRQKDWMYMIRISVPGGGSFNRSQWQAFDDLSERYTANQDGVPSLRITTRQNIQFHWVKKPHLVEIVRGIAQTGFFTLNGCGDNTRNVMGCPLSSFSPHHNANAMAHRLGTYFRLPAEPHIQIFEIDPAELQTPREHYAYGPKLLNRKFKIALSAVHQDPQSGQWHHDNCVELRTNEVGIAPIVENDQIDAFQVYIGGGQGEKNGKPTFAALGKPFGVFAEQELLKGLEAIVNTHAEWGDRKNRHWARMKYVVQKMGIGWFQDQVRQRGAIFDPPQPDFDPGPRMMHHGWHPQETNDQWAYGAYIENGRLINGENGKLKTMARYLMDHYDGLELLTTANQDLLFSNIAGAAKEDFEADMQRFGFGQRNGKPYSRLRLLSGACVGLPTCRLATADSEQFEPRLIDELEQQGYGKVGESIGITGCERQCFRPATKTIGWIGQGPNLYALKIGGSEDGRHQGFWLTDGTSWYLKQVPQNKVATVTATLFDYYAEQGSKQDRDMGTFLRRISMAGVIEYLKSQAQTADLMQKTFAAPFDPGT